VPRAVCRVLCAVHGAGNETALVNDPSENPLELCYVSGYSQHGAHATACSDPFIAVQMAVIVSAAAREKL
jgi:hypothetical protein